MEPPVCPPLTPMLARLARELPGGRYVYEPKWDGFRCLAFRAGAEVDLRSRHGRALTRYFPEVADALLALETDRFVVDGELVVTTASGCDFPALLARIHPAASRVERLSREAPASFIAFDLLAVGDEDLRGRPFKERRRRLIELLESAPERVHVTAATSEHSVAQEWLEVPGDGFDGVVAKHEALRYLPGQRAMVKVKLARAADCVVAGFRWLADRPLPSSLLLGVYEDDGSLEHVGVSSSFSERERLELLQRLAQRVVPLAGHPWEQGFLVGGSPVGRLRGAAGRWTPDMGLDWVPLAPELVCEVAYDHLDHRRFRHPARFLRWRDDREPRSCTFDQFPSPLLAAVRGT